MLGLYQLAGLLNSSLRGRERIATPSLSLLVDPQLYSVGANTVMILCRNPVSSLQRKQYQGGCKFVWNIVTGKHSVVEVDPLTEFGSLEDCEPWNPARGMAKNFHENLPQIPMCQSVRFITNQLVLKGVTLEYLSDMENMIGLVLEGEHQKRL
uniref:Uncharacterized protein n=1 Tax=Timema douglasi TaxID=61478 RepID=A0A7R8VWL5_TIMDO|nr:unnamed protein product [Timema douglasi]